MELKLQFGLITMGVLHNKEWVRRTSAVYIRGQEKASVNEKNLEMIGMII